MIKRSAGVGLKNGIAPDEGAVFLSLFVSGMVVMRSCDVVVSVVGKNRQARV